MQESRPRTPFQIELSGSLRLALPVAIAQIGYHSMSLVDTYIVGQVNAEELAGLGIGHAIFSMILIVGLGMLLSLDTLISQSYGSRDIERCQHYLIQGLYLAFLVFIPLVAVQILIGQLYHLTGAEAVIINAAVPYMNTLGFSLLPILLSTVFQRYWQARNIVAPLVWISIAANVINYFANLAFVLGQWGAPAMGAEGAGWATLASRVFMLFAITAYSMRKEWSFFINKSNYAIDLVALKEMIRLGFPAATQFLFEVLAFTMSTIFASYLGTISLAAHHLALQIASITFMAPFGISVSGAVRVGNAIGAGKASVARLAGWINIGLAAFVMFICGIILLLFPGEIMGIFTADPAVIETGKRIIFFAAFFQVFDGIQVAGTGVLRGLGDTKTPMIAHLVGHYPVGMFLGVTLCFAMGYGVIGLWVGLATGLMVVAFSVLGIWTYRVRGLG